MLREFLPSVLAHSDDAQIIVADNGSTDDSVAVLTAEFPEVEIIKLGKNYGFATGYNRAISQIDTRYIVLLNSDVKVTTGWLRPLKETLMDHANVVAVQPKIRSYLNPEYFEYAGAAGGYLDSLGYPYCRGRIFDTIEKDTGQYDDSVQVDWTSGACMMVRTAAYKEAQGLDDSFFAHMEEIDLCWRWRNMGYTLLCNPASLVYHLGGGTLATGSNRKFYLNFRNSLVTMLKNNRSGLRYGKLFIRMVLDGVAGFKFAIQGRPVLLWVILKAHLSFYSRMIKTLQKRRLLKTSWGEKLVATQSVLSIVFKYYLAGKKNFNEL